MSVLLMLGLMAGVLTTLAGLGGGQLLVLALAATMGPRAALVLSGPALLVGNLHRAWQFRGRADLRLGFTFAAGAVPGSILGGRVAASLPPTVIHALLLGMTGLTLVRAVRPAKPRRVPMAPAGFAIGAVCATTSGAGLLVAPLLFARGLSGAAYVATASICAASLHLGRLGGYALGGMLDAPTLARSAAMAVAIVTGNMVGERLRARMAPRAEKMIENGVLAVCVTLALFVRS